MGAGPGRCATCDGGAPIILTLARMTPRPLSRTGTLEGTELPILGALV